MTPQRRPIHRWLELGAPSLALIVIGLGVIGLLGWAFRLPELQSVVRHLPAMVPNTALGFLLAGSALRCFSPNHPPRWRRISGLIASCGPVALGAITLAEYLTGISIGIDLWLFPEALRQLSTPLPGRPAVLTSLNLLLLGSALLLLDLRTRSGFKPAEVPAVTAFTVAALALIGYVCNVPLFYGWRSLFPATAMALHTVIGFLLLSLGILAARPHGGLVEVVISPTPSGSMARRLLLAPIVIPLLTGMAQNYGRKIGFYNAEFANWFFAFLNILVFTFVIWWNARLLFRAEAVQRRAEDELYQLTTALEERVSTRTTELSAAASALRDNEERVRLVLDTALDAVITADLDGRILSWNREAERVFGWSSQEVTGQMLSQTIIPPAYREAHERGIRHYRATGQGPVLNKRIEITALRRDGSEFPVELAITPVRLGDRTIFSAFVRDITARRDAEEKLRRSEESFRELADVMPQIVWTAKLDGRPDYFNRRWYEYTGTPAGTPNDENWKSVIHPDDWEPSRRVWEQAVANGLAFQVEYRFKDRMTGAHRWHLGRALPVRDSNGRIIRWLGTCTDIDDQKRAQDDARRMNDTLEQRVRDRTVQLEDANKELESFSYSVSHDLRAPLRHIAGFARMLETDKGTMLGETGRRYLNTIADSSRQMGRLIDDLLVFARMGRTELQRATVDMDELLQEVLTELSGEFLERRIEWQRERLPQVTCDRPLLKQVWINLISNAVKYTRPRDPAIIRIFSTQADGIFTFHVRDNGVGFDMQYQEKLFGVFQRLHHADEFEGTGIGLSIVQRIIHKHGGIVRAEGKLDAGATFSFTLPAARPGRIGI